MMVEPPGEPSARYGFRPGARIVGEIDDTRPLARLNPVRVGGS